MAHEQDWQTCRRVLRHTITGNVSTMLSCSHLPPLQNILNLLEEGKNQKLTALETGIQAEKEVEAQLEARHDLFEVFKVSITNVPLP